MSAVKPSRELKRLAAVCADGRVTFRELLPGMTPRDHALLTLFLALCFLHPFPMLGASIPLGLLILLAGARMAAGLGPWVPRRWVNRPLPAKALGRVFATAARIIERVEAWVKPRGVRVAGWRKVHGTAMAVCGLLIVIPLPPPTNFPPATALLLISLGVLEDDAAVLALGYVVFALNLVLFGAIFAYGLDGLRALFV